MYDYEGGKLDWMAFDLPVEGTQAAVPIISAAMRRDAPSCRLFEPASVAIERMAAGGWTWCAVLNDEGVVLGRVRREKAEGAPEGSSAAAVMDEGPSTYRPDLPCEEMVESMKEGGFELAFVTASDGRWLGLVSRRACESLLEKSRWEEAPR